MNEINVWDSDGEYLTQLVQWDRDVTIQVKEPEINKAYDVHFVNKGSDECYVVKSVYSSGTLKVKIPNVLLTDVYPICGYIYVDKPSGEFRTIYVFNILLRARPQPADYVYTESTEYLSIRAIADECKAYRDEIIRTIANNGGGGGGSSTVLSVNGKIGEVVLGANDIKFADGETFQNKFNSGKLKGQKGDPGKNGAPGAKGAPGEKGSPGAKGDPGNDGFSPTITTSKSGKVTTITITDKNGTKTATVLDGKDGSGGSGGSGKDGESAYEIAVKNGFVGSEQEWLNSLKGAKGEPGLNGQPGAKGEPGAKGKPGAAGADGFSPTITTYKSGRTTTITINDINGTKTATILDGKDGSSGSGGASTPGEDGFSPIANVSKSGKTATITITDKLGTTKVSVNDGADGAPGRDGSPGAKGADGKTPVKGQDYYTEAEKQAFVQEVLGALPKWNGGVY